MINETLVYKFIPVYLRINSVNNKTKNNKIKTLVLLKYFLLLLINNSEQSKEITGI